MDLEGVIGQIIADSQAVMENLKVAELTRLPREPGARNLEKKRINHAFKSIKNIIGGLGTVLSEIGKNCIYNTCFIT